MKQLLLSFIIIITSSLNTFSQYLNDLSFGSDSTFDIMTWNLEWFPTNGQATVDSVINIIEALDMDIIAIQEIDNEALFAQLLDGLEGYEGHYQVSSYLEVGYIYKSATIQLDTIYEIYNTSTYNRPFPRKPLLMDFEFMGEEMVVINSHLKCCGNGYMDLNDPWDEETRRYDACNLLSTFVEENYPETKVILVGDFNDLIQESGSSNVFEVFINDSSSYKIVDMEIAEGPQSNWSYPSWPSHLDHIIITNELFEVMEDENSYVQTILIEDNMTGGFTSYENYISDHRPVALKLSGNDINLGIDDHFDEAIQFNVFPNPAKDIVSISSDQTIDEIRIFDQMGKCILTEDHLFNKISLSTFSSGIYIIEIRSKGNYFRKKLINR